MDETSLAVLYLIAAVLFILSLGGLSHQETARRGNTWGIVGMTIAIVGTLLHPHVERFDLIGPAILGGALIGAVMAIRVVMTAMPQLVAILHSFVGLAAVMVGVASYLNPDQSVAADVAALARVADAVGGQTADAARIFLERVRGDRTVVESVLDAVGVEVIRGIGNRADQECPAGGAVRAAGHPDHVRTGQPARGVGVDQHRPGTALEQQGWRHRRSQRLRRTEAGRQKQVGRRQISRIERE